MDIKLAEYVFKATSDIHSDIDELYESIVDDEATGVSQIDEIIIKLKQLKTNLQTNEV